ncbi:site-specific DNA-methyltransferase [Pallidibacillus thermolactis]|uniref:site-specific DNA-methyltransferase n=1 Tax=Pallidibacillus thermolactis TaxID=251051 RepID=UPI0021DB039C|nr:site-specific DNA-methyltransferase [Pallidibacillus thermolactis]MCU9601756.1 site-specific DNA-methyltransferase [Pallidibacillus thermolactis subsp. kokeshiiformis]
METKLQSEIKHVLKQFPEYWEDDSLLKNKVIDDLRNYKKDLIEKLLSNETIKNTYSLQLDNATIFKIEDFISMLRFKNYWENSYTRYSNEIGLTSDDKYLKYNTDVVIDFPHKDCVLEGGMTKEDIGKNEIYYHKILAKEEIDTLLSPKVFTNVKKYDQNGEQEITEYRDTENLIIKGNNLIALHSLKEKFAGKVKLIYIDPPYNTPSAANTFSYNNSFNHSTWLTFMKNRIEIAKELLTEDGIFVVSIDDNELFYLGVLMDEIFGRDNRLGVISVVHNPGGRQDEIFFPTAHENMIYYALDKNNAVINNLPPSKEKLKEYKYSDEFGRYKLRGFRRSGNNSKRVDRPKLYYPIYVDEKTGTISLDKFPNAIELLPIDENGIERCWRWGKETFLEKKDKYIEIKRTKNGLDLYVKERESDYKGEKPKTIWNKSEYTGQTATSDLKKIFNDTVFSYPKSVHLMKDVISITTSKNDIILDFFGGSGTTAQAVLELNAQDGGNRKFILCEQMDYVENVTVERIKKVIKLKKLKDSFIFAEIYKLNQRYVDQILNTNSNEEIQNIIDDIKESAYLDFKINIDKVTNKNSDFASLSLEEKKDILIQALDANQLYLSYSEIDDEQYNVPESVKHFNHSFYKQEVVKNHE